MLKKIMLLCLVLITLFFAAWFLPIHRSIDEKNFNIEAYADDDSIAVVCEGMQTTGPYWRLCYSSDPNIDNKIDFFDTIGNVPENIIKNPLYYYQSRFVFVGNYVKEEKTAYGTRHIFEVKKWYLLGNVDREYFILPYPKRGLNFMEINWKNYLAQLRAQ